MRFTKEAILNKQISFREDIDIPKQIIHTTGAFSLINLDVYFKMMMNWYGTNESGQNLFLKFLENVGISDLSFLSGPVGTVLSLLGFLILVRVVFECFTITDKNTNTNFDFDGETEEDETDLILDFDSYELNHIVTSIQDKANYLRVNSFVQKDIEYSLMVKKTRRDYLQKIYNNYIHIPKKKRGSKGEENTPYDLTFRQLNLLLKALDEIEKKLIADGVLTQKVNEAFLKEKVASM